MNDGTAAKLAIGDETFELPQVKAAVGANGLDVSGLLGRTGMVTVDPGFMNTASCTSDITFIDGDVGQLWYRGYPIEQLAGNAGFLEVAFLLINGELPDQATLDDFTERISQHLYLHEDFREFLGIMPRGSHPMAVLGAGVQMLASFYPESMDPLDADAVELATVLLLAKIPTIIAYIHRRAAGFALPYPESNLSYVENFAKMVLSRPGEHWAPHPALVQALEVLLILHADHEQNCSTSAVRLVGSSQANIYSSIAAGVAALSGPLHGGANEAVLEMLAKIKTSGQGPRQFIEDVKSRKAGTRLMGFGHRVYKNYDPRAAIVKKSADAVLDGLGVKDDLLDIAREIEQIALSDDYFISRRLYPNVDFYTGIIYRAMGFPSSMFTALFALGRLPGWLAHWREMINDPATRIARPRQIYVGQTARDFVAMEDRD